MAPKRRAQASRASVAGSAEAAAAPAATAPAPTPALTPAQQKIQTILAVEVVPSPGNAFMALTKLEKRPIPQHLALSELDSLSNPARCCCFDVANGLWAAHRLRERCQRLNELLKGESIACEVSKENGRAGGGVRGTAGLRETYGDGGWQGCEGGRRSRMMCNHPLEVRAVISSSFHERRAVTSERASTWARWSRR